MTFTIEEVIEDIETILRLKTSEGWMNTYTSNERPQLIYDHFKGNELLRCEIREADGIDKKVYTVLIFKK